MFFFRGGGGGIKKYFFLHISSSWGWGGNTDTISDQFSRHFSQFGTTLIKSISLLFRVVGWVGRLFENKTKLSPTLLSWSLAELGNIDVEMLIDLDTDEFMNMTKELGITTWGHRQTEIEKSNKTVKRIQFWS